jgi:hypothetical protein
MTKSQTIKKAVHQAQEQQPRNIQRADIAPASGFALVVDGHFKTQFESDAVANKTAKELLGKYPMLQVAIYDASAKARTQIKQ